MVYIKHSEMSFGHLGAQQLAEHTGVCDEASQGDVFPCIAGDVG
jgi:hypothetical protein